MDYKKILIMVYAVFGFGVMSLAIHVGFLYLVDQNHWFSLLLGIVIMLLSAIIFFRSKDRPYRYILSFILNMIGVGFSITAYYVLRAYALDFVDFMTAYLLSIGLIALFSGLTYIKFIKRHMKLILSLLVIGFFIGSLLLWISVESFTGLSFYFLNVAYFYLIAIMSQSEDKEDLMREMSIVSFGSFMLVSFIVLVILTEGEALESIGDAFMPSGRKRRL